MVYFGWPRADEDDAARTVTHLAQDLQNPERSLTRSLAAGPRIKERSGSTFSLGSLR